jgi:hypothetical protein
MTVGVSMWLAVRLLSDPGRNGGLGQRLRVIFSASKGLQDVCELSLDLPGRSKEHIRPTEEVGEWCHLDTKRHAVVDNVCTTGRKL